MVNISVKFKSKRIKKIYLKGEGGLLLLGKLEC